MKLKEYRMRNNYKQSDIADYLECVTSVYARYEREQTTITVLALMKLAKLYNTSLESLVGLPEPLSSELSPDEVNILNAYRDADAIAKEDAMVFLKRHKAAGDQEIERQRIRNDIKNQLDSL